MKNRIDGRELHMAADKKKEARMAKRKTAKREMAECKAKLTRERKRKMFEEVCEKGKVETPGDVCGVFCGLSRKDVENAACREIMFHARCGDSPLEIVTRMGGKGKTINRKDGG